MLSRAHAKDFVFLKWLNGRLVNGSNSNGVTESVEDLNRVSVLAAGYRVKVDNLNDIARTEIMLGDVSS
jgi:hypothetical protein